MLTPQIQRSAWIASCNPPLVKCCQTIAAKLYLAFSPWSKSLRRDEQVVTRAKKQAPWCDAIPIYTSSPNNLKESPAAEDSTSLKK